jgi:outer membrane immunogenic protein
MRKEWVFGVAAALIATAVTISGGAFAQVRHAPPVSVPEFDGLYAGISGGFGWGHSNQTDPGLPFTTTATTVPEGDGSFSLNGGVIGGTLGFNWRYGPWVYGLEGDYSWTNINGSSNGCGAAFISHTCSTELDSLGTFRGRIGYTLGPQGTWLVYATGGLAVGDLEASDSLFNASGSEFRAGWTVGAGVETAFWRNWSAKAEYLYVDLGKSVLFNIGPGVPETISFTANVFRVGVNYKFY